MCVYLSTIWFWTMVALTPSMMLVAIVLLVNYKGNGEER